MLKVFEKVYSSLTLLLCVEEKYVLVFNMQSLPSVFANAFRQCYDRIRAVARKKHTRFITFMELQQPLLSNGLAISPETRVELSEIRVELRRYVLLVFHIVYVVMWHCSILGDDSCW